ncbi:MAG: hypothetical protein ABWY55_09960 [Microbacterium sp.]
MIAVATRVPPWSATAIARLEDALACPLCGRRLGGRRCPACGADFTVDDIGEQLWDASQAAVAALRARQEVLDRVERRAFDPRAVAATSRIERGARSASSPLAADPVSPPRSSATVQSVLAVAGAGLVAVAAVVFTFFNPDLTDSFARGLIVAAVTAVFLLGARSLSRRSLQFSAEAVGALGLVFLGLDIHALTALAPQNPWAVAAAATFIAGAGMTALALRIRIRVWIWVSLVALSVVPAMVGYPAGAPVLGHLGTAFAAFALIAATTPFARTFGAPLRAERVTLTVIESAAILIALVQGWLFGEFAPDAAVWALCGTLAASAVLALASTRHPAAGWWSFVAGLFGVGAVAVLPFAALPPSVGVWWMAVVPATAVIGAVAVAVLLPVPSTVNRAALGAGALTVAGTTALPLIASAARLGGSTVMRGALPTDSDASAAVAAGLAALAIGLVGFAVLDARVHPRPVARESADPGLAPAPLGTRWVGYVGLWLGGLAALTVLTIPTLTLWGRVGIGIGIAIAVGLAVARVGRLRAASLAVRVPLIASAHALVLFAAILSWRDLDTAIVGGVAVVVAIAALAQTVPARRRFVHVGAGYAYALVVFATALARTGLEDVAVVCLTTCVGAVVAIFATFAPWVAVRSWYAVLAVTSAPFLLGVAQVVGERSGWTALSTALIFGLALTLVVTRRAGLGIPLRVAAAAVLVPSLAVVVVCLGAQLLEGSGSPVVLPVIALIVALALPCARSVAAALAPRIGVRDAALVRLATEVSTLLTAAIAVLLALVREAAGLPTTFLVLVVLGVGGVATAVWGGRRYGWWLAAAAFSGALWCAWGIAGVDVIEPYLLPPALGAAVVGALLVARGLRGRALYAAGLTAAVVPLVALVAVSGTSVRAYGLVAASWILVALAAMLSGRLTALRPATYTAAIAAGAAGAVQGVRFGVGLAAVDSAVPALVASLGVGLFAAMAAALAARGLRRDAAPGSRLERSRWLYAPAFAYVAVAAWPSIERDWFAIWGMWALMLAFIAAVVVIAQRSLRGPTGLPPVWFVFGLAFATAIVAWSPRDLRVEWFSLPLGAGLLVAGVLAMRAETGMDAAARRSLTAWPRGWSGSWALLGPGIVVAMSASVAATFTDPLTWRAILVIVMALAAILVGAGRHLAAPFLIGIVVLPVENVLAFVVQIGRGIESMPWWITLAVVGAVLLIIAVTYERRAGEDSGIAARLRDLA